MGETHTNPTVVEIARGLVAEGRHESRIAPGNRQAVVDAGWAGRQAGQLLGRRVQVRTSRDETQGGFVVTVVLADA